MFALLAFLPFAAPPFELKDGDRVVWIGSAIAEREQKYGYWETALLCQWPDRKITVRNLGWSGDTVEGIARASFDPPAKGYERLINAVKAEKPTVILVSYGSVEALSGMTVNAFSTSLQKLLDDVSETKARIILFTPTPLENTDAKQQASLDSFAAAIRNLRDAGGYRVADLHELLKDHAKKGTLTFTSNGLHFSEAGYEGTIPDFMTALGLSWAGESPDKFDAIRKAVVKKNGLCFHKYRPQNETYLFGFRKHEQGNNAKEIAEFDALIIKAEADISAALRPQK